MSVRSVGTWVVANCQAVGNRRKRAQTVENGRRLGGTRCIFAAVRKLTQLIVVLTLLLAIPVQGFAAAAMLFCALPQHGGAGVLVQQQQQQHHAVAAGVAHSGHLAGHAAAATEPVATAASAASTMFDKIQLGQHTCSTCTMCCASTAGLPSAALLAQVATTGSAPIALALAWFASHTPEGLDPPPRSV